jgi:uncharacterized repeat protein (TIGR03803 family)
MRKATLRLVTLVALSGFLGSQAQAQTLTVLHSFSSSGTDGTQPHAGLVMDKEGNLYGTTASGGSFGFFFGTVFKVDTTGTETVLHSFSGADGIFPQAGLVMDKEGNLYGTTGAGGSGGDGVVFKLDTAGKETVLHSFTNTPDGATPLAGLIIGKRGNLYGTSDFGGAYGSGTVFELRLLDACTSPWPTTESLRCQAIESASTQ